jgi:hypothetical protein
MSYVRMSDLGLLGQQPPPPDMGEVPDWLRPLTDPLSSCGPWPWIAGALVLGAAAYCGWVYANKDQDQPQQGAGYYVVR